MAQGSSRERKSVPRGRTRPRRRWRRLPLYFALAFATLYSLYPLIAVGLDGMDLNLAALLAQNRLVLIGDVPFSQGVFTFNPIAYVDALTFNAFPARVVNSLIIGGLAVATALVVGIPVSYALARLDMRGKGAISFVLLALRTVSPFAVVVPLYIFFNQIHLWDAYPGVALAELLLVLTVVVWMVKGFFEDIPKSVFDAASVSGATEGQIFRRVALPMVIQGIVITAIFGFILVWNEYLISVIMTGPFTKTVSLGVWSGLGATNKTPDFVDLEAAGTLAFLPAAVVMLAIRKYLAKGFSLGIAR
jgi:multiple sugar transport system permease protein